MSNKSILKTEDIITAINVCSNILIEKSKKIPIIIDFGLSIPLEDIHPETYKKPSFCRVYTSVSLQAFLWYKI